MRRQRALVQTLLALVLFTAGCDALEPDAELPLTLRGTAAAPVAATPAVKAPVVETPVVEAKVVAPAPPRPPAPTIAIETGVEACDDYLRRYYTCIVGKIPPASREMILRSLRQTSEAFHKAAQTEAGRQALAQACEVASESARKALQRAYDCAW